MAHTIFVTIVNSKSQMDFFIECQVRC